ncbi:MAG: hypothetical protein WC307_04150 [Candidatus Nanoarchaeia archaeon]|jgi:FKBP-type peptidyl-prolyl cis-trans isomerase 2
MKGNDVIKLKLKLTADGALVNDGERLMPVGRGYVIKPLDDALLAHSVNDSFKLDLKAIDAYGARARGLIKMVSAKYFRENQVNPYQGMMINVDGLMGKVVSVSPGRVMVDFNHPLAGKDVIYEVSIKELITDPVVIAGAIITSVINEELKSKLEGDSIVINDTIGLPESIKDSIEKEIKEVIGNASSVKNIKFISKK